MTAPRILRAAAALPFVLVTSALYAQTGSFTGKVTSQDGASAQRATITATEQSTSVVHSTKSGDDGLYTLPALPPGTYSIDVSVHGFARSSAKDVQLQVEQSLRLDFSLKVGSVTDEVTVTNEVPVLATETSSIGQVVSGRDVTSLPLLGRDAYALASLVPGVRGSIGMNQLPTDVISTSSISINGAQSTTNDFLLDGAPNSAPAFNQPVLYPIADTVQEFRVQTNNYSAEYGRAAGGIFDVVTKAGTNDLHFNAWEFYRNTSLTANNWFAKAAGQQVAPLGFHQYGGTAGAPVVIPHLYDGHNRTFFFFGTEFVKFNQGVTFTSMLPDPVKTHRRLQRRQEQRRSAHHHLQPVLHHWQHAHRIRWQQDPSQPAQPCGPRHGEVLSQTQLRRRWIHELRPLHQQSHQPERVQHSPGSCLHGEAERVCSLLVERHVSDPSQPVR